MPVPVRPTCRETKDISPSTNVPSETSVRPKGCARVSSTEPSDAPGRRNPRSKCSGDPSDDQPTPLGVQQERVPHVIEDHRLAVVEIVHGGVATATRAVPRAQEPARNATSSGSAPMTTSSIVIDRPDACETRRCAAVAARDRVPREDAVARRQGPTSPTPRPAPPTTAPSDVRRLRAGASAPACVRPSSFTAVPSHGADGMPQGHLRLKQLRVPFAPCPRWIAST